MILFKTYRTPILPYLLGVLVTLTGIAPTFAQHNGSATQGITATFYNGGLFNYRYDMPRFSFPGLYGFSLGYYKDTPGTKAWHSRYGNPRLAAEMEGFTFGAPNELGNIISTTGLVSFRLLQNQYFCLSANIGTGLVYSHKRFDPDRNPRNEAISTRISYVLRAGAEVSTHLNQNFVLGWRLGFRHYSNGSMRMPNNGLNFLVTGLNLKYQLSANPLPKKVATTPDSINRKAWHIHALIAIAAKESAVESQQLPAFTTSLYLSKRTSFYNSVMVGFDGFKYAQATQEAYAIANKIDRGDRPLSGYQMAVTVGNLLHFGKLGLITQVGFYLYEPDQLYSSWYQRYGLRLMSNRGLFLQAAVKGYGLSSDLFEFGTGFRLSFKQ